MTKVSCGIDFGTSNSTCAISTAQETRLVMLEDDKVTLPSTIFFGKSAIPLFGRRAVDAYMSGEEGRLMKALKSVLGTSLIEEKTIINAKSISFIEILSHYFKNLKDTMDQQAGVAMEDVVLGRPVHFHDHDERADHQSQLMLEVIARSVGFKNIAFQYEPIAAAFSHEMKVHDERLSLVIDLGGGTSDFTIIRLSPDRRNKADRQRDILATTGIRVGGTNFDKSLSLDVFMPWLGLHSEYSDPFNRDRTLVVPSSVYHDLSDWAKVPFAQTAKAIRSTKDILKTAIDPEWIENLLDVQERQLGHSLLQAVENAKISLTDSTEIAVCFKDLTWPIEADLTRLEFEESISGHVQRISDSVDDCLKQAGVRDDDIGLVILTGGSTELPVINALVRKKFSRATISSDNKFGSVGLGLAYYAKSSVFI